MGIASDFVLIVLAGLAGALAARALRLPLMVGYIAAGILVGPYTSGPKVEQTHEIELLAEIGVALLLFSLGLELSFRDLQPVRRVALLGGPVQILVTAALGGFAASVGLGMSPREAVWFGTMISVSSTAIVLKTLAAAGATQSLASRVMVGLLVVQDLAVVPMLVILPQLGSPGNLALSLARAIGLAAAILAAIVIVGTRLLPGLLRRIADWGSRELFLITVVAIGVGVGYGTHLAGLSFALGAFVAGIVLSESEFSHQALSDVVPIRDIFGLLFFVSVGMLLDPAYALAHAGRIAAVVALTFVGKSIIAGGVTRAFGYVNMAPWIVGLGLSQIGEFSFVLARAGLTSGSISRSVYNLVLTCTVLTMALSPLVSGMALPLGRAWRRWQKPAPISAKMEGLETPPRGHVIVAGFGRSGKAAARILQGAGIPLVIVEINHSIFGGIGKEGISAIWGDITGEEILKAAGIESARMLLMSLPDQNTVRLAVQRARQLNPRIAVIARALRAPDVETLRKIGVDTVIQVELEGGIEMVRQALIQYHGDDLVVAQLIEDLRRDFYGRESKLT